ncbi:septum formation initiator family protein [Parendozoicomonas haliclonae]|uniref:Cell division protein FtsB n=1 Tax=Parendozoicomonas haliclonae TaxID=1960125 RepID=A0A1X7AI10_9GAMM|nr:septum formation initiator family protein [Parendozoicomonas haliclonae]SMA42151.1 Cell division protein FtsB [Parendozoicomonas haliclonae]
MAMILRPAHLVLLALLVVLQFSLWVGEGSYAQYRHVTQQVQKQQQENKLLEHRNNALAAEVVALQEDKDAGGLEAVEAMARLELGMIRKGETFFYMPD